MIRPLRDARTEKNEENWPFLAPASTSIAAITTSKWCVLFTFDTKRGANGETLPSQPVFTYILFCIRDTFRTKEKNDVHVLANET